MPLRIDIHLKNACPFKLVAIQSDVNGSFVIADVIYRDTRDHEASVDTFVAALRLAAYDQDLAPAVSTRPHLQFDNNGFIFLPDVGKDSTEEVLLERRERFAPIFHEIEVWPDVSTIKEGDSLELTMARGSVFWRDVAVLVKQSENNSLAGR